MAAFLELVCILLPIGAFLLWYFSLSAMDVRKMNDLGLVSIMPPSLFIGLALMMVSFTLTLQRPKLRTPIILLHFALLLFMLFTIHIFIEQEPRFDIVYRHNGYTEYIMRTGTVDPSLDAYFSWPGFFVFSAFVTRIAGYQSVLAYANWAPLFYNIIYMGPLYMIFTTFTSNKRLVWLSMWIFAISNWIGQDYFSPQGLNLFLYLVIIAILVTWFKSPPERRISALPARLGRIRFVSQFYAWLTAPSATASIPTLPLQRYALLASLLTVFGFSVFGHQLTPFFILASVTALVLFSRCSPKVWWLPLALAAMIAAWLIFMARPYLAGHMDQAFGGLTKIMGIFSSNVSNRLSGNPEHSFIARMRIIMTFLLWLLALFGGTFRLIKGHKDANAAILAIVPIILLVIQPYGGEMLLRCYLFMLVGMSFFAASIFFDVPSLADLKNISWFARVSRRFNNNALLTNKTIRNFPQLQGILIAMLLFVLLSGFLFTRYGNENTDYKTYDEVNGVFHLYDIAAPHSLFVAGWLGTPWQVKDFEKFQLVTLADDDTLINAVDTNTVNTVIRFMQSQPHSQAYILFSRSQKTWFNAMSGLPAGKLDSFENTVALSGDFNLVYRNNDIQIYQLVSAAKGE
ncbi:hypothetical protein [Ktedonobacter racemifer]|nr:hypothetical protein [Ktedonobacter racemifer]